MHIQDNDTQRSLSTVSEPSEIQQNLVDLFAGVYTCTLCVWHVQRWVAAFQPSLIGTLVTTTNGLERQHENLKYSYLVDMSNESLADVISVIVITYVPNCQQW